MFLIVLDGGGTSMLHQLSRVQILRAGYVLMAIPHSPIPFKGILVSVPFKSKHPFLSSIEKAPLLIPIGIRNCDDVSQLRKVVVHNKCIDLDCK